MILLSLLLACLALVLWNVLSWPAVEALTIPSQSGPAPVAILIPARNEELNLAACLDTLLAQPLVAEILIYDDGSSDGTAAIAASWAARDPRIRLALTQPLPPSWSGKSFACASLAAQSQSPWLLFLDADARLTPNAIPRMLHEAQSRRASFLSCWPGLEMQTFAEQWLMPLLNFVVFTLYPAPLGLHFQQQPSLSLAHGACILVDRHVYEAIGGHTTVASEIFEDTQLARIWRTRGERTICLDGQDIVRVRMYRTAAEIWWGFQKNFRSAFRHGFSFWAFLLMHAALFLAPFLLFSKLALIVVAIRLILAVRFKHPLWSALLHPFAELFLLALGLASAWMWRRSRGVSWKGRVYRPI